MIRTTSDVNNHPPPPPHFMHNCISWFLIISNRNLLFPFRHSMHFFLFLSTYSIFIFLTPVIELYLNISVYQSQHKLLLPIVIHNQIKNLPISVYLCLLFRLNPNTHTSFCLSRGISVLLIICNVRNIWFGLFDETCHASRSDHFHHSAH